MVMFSDIKVIPHGLRSTRLKRDFETMHLHVLNDKCYPGPSQKQCVANRRSQYEVLSITGRSIARHGVWEGRLPTAFLAVDASRLKAKLTSFAVLKKLPGPTAVLS